MYLALHLDVLYSSQQDGARNTTRCQWPPLLESTGYRLPIWCLIWSGAFWGTILRNITVAFISFFTRDHVQTDTILHVPCHIVSLDRNTYLMFTDLVASGWFFRCSYLQRSFRRRGAPLLNYIGNLSKKNWLWRSVRPFLQTLHVSRCQMSGYFGGKAYGHPRLVKQRQLKSQ